VFDESAQSNFAMASFEKFDENIQLYDSSASTSVDTSQSSSKSFTRSSSSQASDSLQSSITNFIRYEFAGLLKDKANVHTNLIDVNYEEGSESNKRSREEERSRIIQNSSQLTEKRMKKKEQKRMRKKIDSNSIVDLFNENLDKYDASVSVRQMLQNNKMNII
jgi:hypothetical protein